MNDVRTLESKWSGGSLVHIEAAPDEQQYAPTDCVYAEHFLKQSMEIRTAVKHSRWLIELSPRNNLVITLFIGTHTNWATLDYVWGSTERLYNKDLLKYIVVVVVVVVSVPDCTALFYRLACRRTSLDLLISTLPVWAVCMPMTMCQLPSKASL